MRLGKIAATIGILFSSHSYAVVCIDPSGNGLQLSEMGASAARWVEEKGIFTMEYAQNMALSTWESLQSEYRASAQISATTTAISETANAEAQERYTASPSACATFTRAKALMNSFESICDNPIVDGFAESNAAKIQDCGFGGSGLNCGVKAAQQKAIATTIRDAIVDQDGDTLSVLLDPSIALGLSSTPMHPDNQAVVDQAFALLLGVEKGANLPRTASGELYDEGDLYGNEQMTAWAAKHGQEVIANAALTRIHLLYRPVDGKQSPMEQIGAQVDYYNSDEFIKLLTNTNDKSSLPSNWETMTAEARHEYNQNLPIEERITGVYESIRMIGEMTTLSVRLQKLQLDAAVSNNTLSALLLKSKLKG